jgi:uncharacterized membrane protein
MIRVRDVRERHEPWWCNVHFLILGFILLVLASFLFFLICGVKEAIEKSSG